MNLCEFGGHRRGPSAAGISLLDMKIFQGPTAPSFSIHSNYLTAWGFDADTNQFGVREAVPKITYDLSSEVCDPELVVHHFEHGVGIVIIQGNLHIRIPNNSKVSMATRKRMVREGLHKLMANAPSDSAAQPVVYVLVGDCNLSKEAAEEAIQELQPEHPDWQSVWHVHATAAKLSGDLIFVKGAIARSFDLPFGRSHRDRGIRHDDHDAIGIELRVNIEPPTPSSKRNRTSDAPQLAPKKAVKLRVEIEPPTPSSKRNRTSDAPQLAPKKAVNCLVHNVANNLEVSIRQFWENRGEEGAAVLKDGNNLRNMLFRKKNSLSIKTSGSLVFLSLGKSRKSSTWRQLFPKCLC